MVITKLKEKTPKKKLQTNELSVRIIIAKSTIHSENIFSSYHHGFCFVRQIHLAISHLLHLLLYLTRALFVSFHIVSECVSFLFLVPGNREKKKTKKKPQHRILQYNNLRCHTRINQQREKENKQDFYCKLFYLYSKEYINVIWCAQVLSETISNRNRSNSSSTKNTSNNYKPKTAPRNGNGKKTLTN